MKAMTSFTLKSLRASTARTVVTIAGVALAAALLVAVLSSYVSATDYLLRNEIAANGTWMARSIVPDDAQSRDEIAAAEKADDVKALATLQDVGFVAHSDEQAVRLGTYLPVLTGAGSLEDVCGVRVGEGRLPQSSDEIVLPYTWKRWSAASIGDVVTLDIGERRAVQVPGTNGGMSGGTIEAGTYDPELGPNGIMYSIEDGSSLNSTMGYLDPANDNGIFSEELVDASPRSYTVVGFTSMDNWSLMTGVGPAALTVDEDATGDIQVYVDLTDISTAGQLKERMNALFPDADTMMHTNLLRYSGISDHGSIWQTLFYLVAILAVIIMAACISLIYNAFAISVNERMRQFGLLASIGASKRQLRRSVLLEGSIIAVIGIPLGILIGLGACAGIFAWLGGAIADILGGMHSDFFLVVSWQVVLFAVALTALTVLVSVWIPALRAAHISPIDALRQSSTIRLSRNALRTSGQQVRPASLWKHRGITGAVFGIGGSLASLNHKRNASKGRAASLSLALAIILLMTAGSLSTQLGTFTKVVGHVSEADISMGISLSPTSDKAATPAALEATCADAYESASAVQNVTPLGWALNSWQPGIVPADVAGNALKGSVTDDSLVDGDVPTMLSVIYMPDDEFAAYAKDNGIALPTSADGAIAIGVREGYGNTGTMYTYDELFAQSGKLDIVTGVKNVDDAYLSLTIRDTTEDGREQLQFVMLEGDRVTDHAVPASDLARTSVNVIGLADQSPACASSSNGATIVMPMSAASVLPPAAISRSLLFSAAFDSPEPAEAIEPLKEIAPVMEKAGYDIYYNQVTDNGAAEESMRMAVTVVNVFCFLFSFILTLIALANVFNTVTNGLILRKREFAVMESIGMDARQFRSMIGCECIGYGMRGLIPGIIVSVIVSYLLYLALSISMTGLPFTLPWAYLALACAVVIVIMALSVAYGLRRCRKGDIVEALRME
ncbi:MAG: FtsX-like permease family protein [Coriobacteriales bacterium]